MEKRRFLGMFLAISLVFTALSLVSMEAAAQGNYDDKLTELGVKFIAPEGWQQEEDANSPKEALFLASPDKKAIIGVIWNKKLGSDEDSFQSGLSEYRDLVKGDMRFISEDRIAFCGVICYVFELEKDLLSGGSLKKFKFKTYIFFKNGRAYDLEYTAAAEDFDRYLPEFEKMLATFEVR